MFISHDLGSVAGIADRIAVLYQGEIVEVGAARAVINAPAARLHPAARRLGADAALRAADRAERDALRAQLERV